MKDVSKLWRQLSQYLATIAKDGKVLVTAPGALAKVHLKVGNNL
jgi:hypothetical protein